MAESLIFSRYIYAERTSNVGLYRDKQGNYSNDYNIVKYGKPYAVIEDFWQAAAASRGKGGLMLFHGLHKLIGGVDGINAMLVAKGFRGFIAYGVLVGEVVAPILTILGILTRPAALVLAFTMIVAWLMVELGETAALEKTGAWAIESTLFFIAALAIAFMGAGKYALGGHSAWR